MAAQHLAATDLWDINWCELERRVQWLQGVENCLQLCWESSDLAEKKVLRCLLALLVVKRCYRQREDDEAGSLGDGWRCCTKDKTMAAAEQGLCDGWKQRTQLGRHRCLDVKKCRDGGSQGELGYERTDTRKLGSVNLVLIRSRVYKIHAVAEEKHCVCQNHQIPPQMYPGKSCRWNQSFGDRP